MKLIDAVNIVAGRLLAGAVDKDTAEEQVVVLLENYSTSPAKLALDLSRELLSIKAALAASKRGSVTATSASLAVIDRGMAATPLRPEKTADFTR